MTSRLHRSRFATFLACLFGLLLLVGTPVRSTQTSSTSSDKAVATMVMFALIPYLVLSSALDCVRAGNCTVGIASTPRVEVIVSTQQAQASGIQFSEAFRMMVTEY